jgi:hypothetical protein
MMNRSARARRDSQRRVNRWRRLHSHNRRDSGARNWRWRSRDWGRDGSDGNQWGRGGRGNWERRRLNDWGGGGEGGGESR